MKLVFATNNKHKLKEVKEILDNQFEILSLKDINCFEEIPETQNTITGNASQKAHYVYDKYKINCFADDTGLEIETLNGEPGVYSARYAGKNCSYEDNVRKVLKKLQGKTNRNALFRTVISLIIDGKEHKFEGIIKGEITKTKKGSEGFGYDPIFLPAGYEKSFAELPANEKNRISHRGLATQKLINFLKTL
ncbi:MAG: non-canonical purine NTP diphosphatase [Bacteroidales bacterium]|nr:non-canonical purine NTP diphosphatase [Bacteroidales bacterium]